MGMGGQLRAPAALPPGKRSGTHCTGDWVCPTIGLDRREISPNPPSGEIRSPHRSVRGESVTFLNPYKRQVIL